MKDGSGVPPGNTFQHSSAQNRKLLFFGVCIPLRLILTIALLTFAPHWLVRVVAGILSLLFLWRALCQDPCKTVWWNRYAHAFWFAVAAFWWQPALFVDILFGILSGLYVWYGPVCFCS